MTWQEWTDVFKVVEKDPHREYFSFYGHELKNDRELLKAFADELVERCAGIPVTEEGMAIINCMNEMLHEAGVER